MKYAFAAVLLHGNQHCHVLFLVTIMIGEISSSGLRPKLIGLKCAANQGKRETGRSSIRRKPGRDASFCPLLQNFIQVIDLKFYDGYTSPAGQASAARQRANEAQALSLV
jgi:hypothetical protein